MTRWYRIHWMDDKSHSDECYTYGDAWAAAKAQTADLGRFKIVLATDNIRSLLAKDDKRSAASAMLYSAGRIVISE